MMTDRQLVVATVMGVVLWFAAATTVRLVPAWFDGGETQAILFAATILTGIATVLVAERLGRADGGELVAMMAWGTGIALVLDGLGVGFLSRLYAGPTDATRNGLAVIAWGAGTGLLAALMRAQWKTRRGERA